MAETIRWGILSTANIARGSFLPGLREAGGGEAYAVASRNERRAREFARANGVELALGSYEALLADDRIDAVYIGLPNSLHAEWTIAALRAGKAVLCEKPMCVSAEETARVLDVARETGRPLWEAFVFPFHIQMERVRRLVSDGALGDVREVQSSFHFVIRSRQNIRLSPELAGGALMDVGCYCVRLGRFVFDAEADAAAALAVWAPEGVDEEMHGVLGFPGDRRLLFSCGMRRPNDTLSRVIGTEGTVEMTNAFHPADGDTLTIRRGDRVETEDAYPGERSFTPAVRHIHGVLRGDEAPRHLAVDEAMGNATAMDALQRSARAPTTISMPAAARR